MTVGELIEMLKKFPADLPVWRSSDRGDHELRQGPELRELERCDSSTCEWNLSWSWEDQTVEERAEQHGCERDKLQLRPCVKL